ncbi:MULTISPECIES: S8 family serine peptidase [Clostridium]|uniref:S8 family serine peptidase n=1 Tax=Clostridium TaxID=1485 RepID=UPI0008244DB5|nr:MULTISPECIES: S8 family serine peptidase [Clostridium]PJI09178.1 peptidase S8 [Clostridium sp. CT7]
MKKRHIFLFINLILLVFLPTNIRAFAQKISTGNINLIITYNNNTIDPNVEKLITDLGGQVTSKIPELGTSEVKCSPECIEKIKSYATVESISPNPVIKIHELKVIPFNESGKIDNTDEADLFNYYQWDIKEVTDNGKSFLEESGNHNVVVGILDTGVNTTHPDLKKNFLGGKNFVPKNFENDSTETGDTNDIEDRVGHGTLVAGTIAGNGRIKGVAPNTGFKSYRIFNKDNDTTDSIAASAIVNAVNDNVKVLNLSFGGFFIKGKCIFKDPKTQKIYNFKGNNASCLLYKKAIRYAEKHGVTVVASVGNEGIDCSKSQNIVNYVNNEFKDQGLKYAGEGIELPGEAKNVITVSASKRDDTIASYSNYGQNVIDIAAPGGELVDINNINNPQNIYNLCLSSYLNNSYFFTEGTSLAAPKVSAVAALIISKYGNIKPKEVAKIIYKSAVSINTQNSREYFGHGVINAYNALAK